MWSVDQLTADQRKQINAVLSKRIGGRYMITGEVARIIKEAITQDINKGTTDPKEFAKAVEAARNALTKTSGKTAGK